MAKAYRFGDVVALNTEAGTVYIPAPEAARLARSLAAAARSVASGERFQDSNVSGPDIADYCHSADAHNVAWALSLSLIKAVQATPGRWIPHYREKRGDRWISAGTIHGESAQYVSPRTALAAAVYRRGVRFPDAGGMS